MLNYFPLKFEIRASILICNRKVWITATISQVCLEADRKALRADSLIDLNLNNDLMRFKHLPSIHYSYTWYEIFTIFCMQRRIALKNLINNFFCQKRLIGSASRFLRQINWLNIVLTIMIIAFWFSITLVSARSFQNITSADTEAHIDIGCLHNFVRHQIEFNRNKLILIG